MSIEELNSIQIIPLIETLRLQKIDDDAYFSKKYSGYISNSRLSLINPEQDGSPEKFFEGFKPVYSSAFDLGSFVHQLTLQNDLFYLVESVNKPTAKLGCLADRLYSIYVQKEVTDNHIIEEATVIDYYHGNLNEKKLANVREQCMPYWESRKQFESTYNGDKELIYSDEKTRQTVWNCVKALNSNRLVQSLLHPKGLISDPISENEQAILLDVLVKIPNREEFIF